MGAGARIVNRDDVGGWVPDTLVSSTNTVDAFASRVNIFFAIKHDIIMDTLPAFDDVLAFRTKSKHVAMSNATKPEPASTHSFTMADWCSVLTFELPGWRKNLNAKNANASAVIN